MMTSAIGHARITAAKKTRRSGFSRQRTQHPAINPATTAKNMSHVSKPSENGDETHAIEVEYPCHKVIACPPPMTIWRMSMRYREVRKRAGTVCKNSSVPIIRRGSSRDRISRNADHRKAAAKKFTKRSC